MPGLRVTGYNKRDVPHKCNMKITGMQQPCLLKKEVNHRQKRKITERQRAEGQLFIYVLAKLNPLH